MKNVVGGDDGGGNCACIPLTLQCISPITWGSCYNDNFGVGQLCCSL